MAYFLFFYFFIFYFLFFLFIYLFIYWQYKITFTDKGIIQKRKNYYCYLHILGNQKGKKKNYNIYIFRFLVL